MTEERMEYGVVPFETVMSMGEVFAKSGYFTDAKQQAQAVVKMLAGQEMGVGPFASMSGIHIIQGKPEVGAHLLAAVLKRSGKYDYRIKQPIKTDAVTLEFFQVSHDGWESIGESTFTAEDAKKAGTGNMQKFPRNMLFARALSNGVKWYCPDVSLSPLYSQGEIDPAANVEYETGEIIEAEVVERAKPNGNRPWGADTLKTNILKRAEQLQAEGNDWLNAPHPGFAGAMVNTLNGILGDDDRRHTFLLFVFGDPSTKTMNKAQVQAVMNWLEGQAGLEIITDEANRLVNSVVTANAVGTLPGIDSVKGDAKAPF